MLLLWSITTMIRTIRAIIITAGTTTARRTMVTAAGTKHDLPGCSTCFTYTDFFFLILHNNLRKYVPSLFPTFQMKKLKFKEIKYYSQDHRVN